MWPNYNWSQSSIHHPCGLESFVLDLQRISHTINSLIISNRIIITIKNFSLAFLASEISAYFTCLYNSIISGCSVNLTDHSKSISTLGYPGRNPKNLSCVWRISRSPEARNITFYLYTFETQYGSDSLIIRNSTGSVLSSLSTNSSRKLLLVNPDDDLTIHFTFGDIDSARALLFYSKGNYCRSVARASQTLF